LVTCSDSARSSIASWLSIRFSTMLTNRTASVSTPSCALLSIVRDSTITSDTPKTAMTTSTTASVD
jgi:hypothetical protein